MSEENTPSEGESSEEVESFSISAPDLWSAIEQLFQHYYDGVLVRGAVLLDIYDTEGQRQFEFEAPDDTAPWDIRALALQAVHDIDRISTAVTVMQMVQEMEEADEEAEDDE